MLRVTSKPPSLLSLQCHGIPSLGDGGGHRRCRIHVQREVAGRSVCALGTVRGRLGCGGRQEVASARAGTFFIARMRPPTDCTCPLGRVAAYCVLAMFSATTGHSEANTAPSISASKCVWLSPSAVAHSVRRKGGRYPITSVHPLPRPPTLRASPQSEGPHSGGHPSRGATVQHGQR